MMNGYSFWILWEERVANSGCDGKREGGRCSTWETRWSRGGLRCLSIKGGPAVGDHSAGDEIDFTPGCFQWSAKASLGDIAGAAILWS